MPRVIDYNPVGAIGALSAGAGQAAAATQEYEAAQRQKQAEIAARAQILSAWMGSGGGGGGRGPMTPANGRPTGEVIDNQTGTEWDPKNGYRSMEPGQPARVRYQDPTTGQDLSVTETQKSQLQTLDGRTVEPDERKSAVDKIMGLQVPDLVTYTDPQGKTYRLKPNEAATREAADRKHDIDVKQKAAQFADSMQYRYATLQEHHDNTVQKMQQLEDAATSKAMDKDEAAANAVVNKKHANSIARAKSAVEEATTKFKADPYNPANQTAMEDATTKLKGVYDDVQKDLDARLQKLSTYPDAASATTQALPQGKGAKLTDKAMAQQFLEAAGGDKAKARELAAKPGWNF